MNEPRVVASYPLSAMQQGMLLHSLQEEGVYIQQMVCELREDVDEAILMHAWEEVTCRHDILRSTFLWEGVPKPVQNVFESVELPWNSEDWNHLNAEQQDEAFERFLLADRKSGFAVTSPPLQRCSFIKFDDGNFRLVWTFHHALLDGRSHFMVLEEVFSRYDAARIGENPVLQPRHSYRDYIQWLEQQDWSNARTFWANYLRGFRPLPDLRLDGGSNRKQNLCSQRSRASESISLSPETSNALKLAAQQHEITLNTMVQGAWAVLLSRYYGTQDVIFGVTRACRHATVPDAESRLGLFINTLPLRVELDPHRSVGDWLKELRRQQITFRDFEHTPLTLIQEVSEAPRGKSLFESVLVFENYELNERINPGKIDRRQIELLEQTQYPLTLAAYAGQQLRLKLEYDERRFDTITIQSMLGHLATLLEGMLTESNRPIGELPMLTETERRRVLFDWNQIIRRPHVAGCLHEIFSEQARNRPNATAVVFEGESLTFAELDARSSELALYLGQLGVGPEQLVALCVHRSLDMIIGVLGILKAGGAYLPLDPAYPSDRLAFMIEDSGAHVVLTEESLRERFADHKIQVVCLNSDWKTELPGGNAYTQQAVALAAAVSPLNVAYVVYTSGSTGQPKGVSVTHENVLRLFDATQSLFGFDHTDVWTLFHSYAFDFSVWEMWGALLYGGLLVAVPYWISRAPKKFYELVKAAKVTVLNQTPSAFRQFVEVEDETLTATNSGDPPGSSLRLMIFGGEELDSNTVNRWFEKHHDRCPELVNMYGITETTVHVTHQSLKKDNSTASHRVPIGRPLSDLQVYILDRQLQPLPVGVAGEMYVGGAGISRGYLKRPDLTAERFLPHPFTDEPGERIYRTGDMARFLRDGSIEYLGRSDRQVKVRGFRIELGEIEAVLAKERDVQECLVTTFVESDNNSQLTAYLVPRAGRTIDREALRARLKNQLPPHMIPAYFVLLERFPLTANGKIDREALPAPDKSRDDTTEVFVAPRNELEVRLTEIWSEVLNRKEIGIFDNFFYLGGHSLLAAQVIARVASIFRVSLPLREFFDEPTVAALATFVSAAELQTVGAPPIKRLRRD